MDKQLLRALDNLSFGLEMLVEALKDQKTAKTSTAQAIKGGDFGGSLEQINASIKSVKKDTQEILKNQQTIIALQKKKSRDKNTEAFEGDEKKQSSIKKGASMILLIAVAVLAIGMAFKIVGKIDFLSVIGLGLAILAISFAFEKVGKLKLSVREAAITSLTMVLMALAVTMSSWILRLITPISLTQSLTGILISAMFFIISTNFVKIAEGVTAFDRFRISKLALLTTLVGIATAITLSSWILRLVSPMSLGQALTAILISAMFFVISINFVKIAEGVAAFDRLKISKITLLLTLVGIATAITLSSWILSLVTPIQFSQFLTALGVALLFGLMSYVMPELAVGVYILEEAIGKKGLLTMPLVFIAISLAIMLSSHILSLTADIDFTKILKILAFGISLGIMIFTMLPSVLLVGIAAVSGVGAAAIGLGVLMIPLIAASIAISSNILGMGKYDKYPGIKWAIGVGLSMTAFGVATLALGVIALTGIGAVAILAGAALTPIIAKTIVTTDKIISKGKYDKYPGLKWILSVGTTMTSFGLAIIGLGVLALTGIGAVAILAGSALVPKIAKTIVAVDKIIAKGSYEKFPSTDWAKSVGGLMIIFGSAVVALGVMIVSSFGLGYIALKTGSKAVKIIAQSIVDVAWIFNKNSSAFKKGPKKEWAEGVGIAIGAFAPVYKMLTTGGIMKIFTGSGPTPKQFKEAIITISLGIIDAAKFFAEHSGVFKNGPRKEWAEGVGKAIGAFAPVYAILANEKGLLGSGVSVEKFKKAILTITNGIIESAKIFAKNKAPFKEGNYPSVKWGQGVGSALKAFTPVFKSLSEDTGWFTSGDDVINNMVNGIIKMSKAIVRVSNILKDATSWDSYPTKKWSWNVKLGVESFIRLAKKSGKEFINYNNIIRASSKIVEIAKMFGKSKDYFNTNINPKFIKNLRTSILDFNQLAKELSKSQEKSLSKSLTDSILSNDPITQIARRMITLAKGYDKLASSLIKLSIAMRMLNLKSLSQLGGLISYKSQEEGSEISQVRTPQSRIVGKEEGGRSIISSGKNKDEYKVPQELAKKNQIFYVSQQLEKMNKILTSIEANSDSINQFLNQNGETKGKLSIYPMEEND